MGFPTGLRESSGILLEKVVPAEVLLGKPFSYEYKVVPITPSRTWSSWTR